MDRNVIRELKATNLYKYFQLPDDLENHVQKFVQLKESYNKAFMKCNEQQSVIAHLRTENEDFKNTEELLNRELSSLRKVCKLQEQSIANLYSLEGENSALKKINVKLESSVEELKEEIERIQKSYDVLIKAEAENYKEALKREESNYQNKLEEIQGEIKSIKTSSELKEQDLQNELKRVTSEYNENIKEAEKNIQKHKEHITKLNNHLTTNIAIYQKKVLELEAKLKILERERSIYLPNNINSCSSHLDRTNKNIEILKYFAKNKKNFNCPETTTETSNAVVSQSETNKNEINICEPSTGIKIIKGRVSSKATYSESSKENEPLNLSTTDNDEFGIDDCQQNTAKDSSAKTTFPMLKKTKYDN